MNHFTEEDLIAYREGEITQREAIAAHLTACQACRAELERIEAVLRALDNLPVPERGPDYGRAVWRQIAPRLPEKAGRGAWLEPRRLLAFGFVAAMVLVAFIAGRWTGPKNPGTLAVADTAQVRERILVVAIGDHLGKSEMVLMELANAAPATRGQKVDISAEQRRAEDLLDANRLYRESARQEGDAALASVLDDLERVLTDVAHSPDEITPARLESLQKRIEEHGILFKVRVVGKELQDKEKTNSAPTNTGSDPRERNKA